jgi:arylsulfatase A-like enzyme
VASLLVTLWAKAVILRDLAGMRLWPLVWLGAVAIDVVVFMGLAALFAVGEGRSPWLWLVTGVLTALITTLALINGWYLAVTGEQLSWDAVVLGLDRFADLQKIVREAVLAQPVRAVAVGAGLAAVPLGCRWLLRRAADPPGRRPASHQRAHCAAAAATIGMLVALLAPAPNLLPARQLGASAVLRTYWTWLTEPDTVDANDADSQVFLGYDPPFLVTDASIAGLAARTRPNILLVVLESTRFDHTSLAEARLWRGTETPNLAALSRRGTTAAHAYVVLPHTTKSLVSILCARYPAMQEPIIEISANFHVQCLPEILGRAGYATGFFQSSWGTFEERPRLVDKLGYQHFEAWEDIQGEKLGYLASDDESLTAPVARWLAGLSEGTPFFVTVLTSATHHPYRISAAAMERARGLKTVGTDEERYARLVEAEDAMLGALLDVLAKRGVAESTLVIALADHGEGFGAKGIRQHDNNFYQEGVHVPLVLAGPGIPQRTIAGNVSLADVTPTVLAYLGVPIATEAAPSVVGTNLLADRLPERTLFFSCWYALHCRGLIHGTDKVVYRPDRREAYHFDLAADPEESHARPVPARLRPLVDEMNRVLEAHRNELWRGIFGPARRYGAWRCEPDQKCAHPNATGDW